MKKNYFDLLKEIPDQELVKSLYITQILLLTIAFFLGVFLFDSPSAFFELFRWDDPNVLIVGMTAGIAVVVFDSFLMKILPPKYYDDGGLNDRIFQKRSILEIAGITLFVAMGEEILFRGVLQTHFGLVMASLIFAAMHYRYLFNWYLFINVTGLSFLIGYIYFLTENIVVTMTMHFIIDFVLGCIIKMKFDKSLNEQEGIFDE